ncbi:SDR family NAD(P)-dependent oxidoreductase [Lysinimonas soli]|uniref:SDR family NAD(P)-dependent oxidoreductase n=1 Tax=Lysinimonas soli TaxID=1074233 RepID=A0ABW0NSB3_9MICO
MTLEGRVVVVTGAARGLGRGIAHRLADDGARVAVVDLDLRSYRDFPLEAAAMTGETTDAELRAMGHRSRGYEVDLSDARATAEVFATIRDELGPIDGLVCNAGGGSGDVHGNRASSLDLVDLESALRRNLVTTVTCCTAVAEQMRTAGRGSIVTMSSVNGVKPTDDGGYAHYGVAKAAVAMYTRYLARDLAASGVRANAIAPGTVPTGRLREVWEHDGSLDAVATRVPFGRLPRIAEIADVVRFLVSDESSYITGQTISIDGGATL